jgi:hypothetical protein
MATDMLVTSFIAPKPLLDQLGFLLAILRKSRSEFLREAIELHIKNLRQEILIARDRNEEAYQAYMLSEMPVQQEKEAECEIPKRKYNSRKKFGKESRTS